MTDKFQVGDGVTYTIWTDKVPGTVIAVTPKRVTIRLDKCHFDKTGRPLYEPDPEGEIVVFSLRKSGVWKSVGCPSNQRGGRITYGRDYHFDEHF